MFCIKVILSFLLLKSNSVISTDVPSEIEEFTFNEDLEIPFHNRLEENENVTIKVYYESLCYYCREFDSTKLVTVVKKLADYLDVHTFPYGNARTFDLGNGEYNITCQHGPAECYGNQLHACAIDIFKNMTEAVIYNGCMMESSQAGSGSDDQAADACGKRMGVDSGPIKQCAQSQHGFDLLKHYGDLSQGVGYEGVPYILVNDFPSGSDVFFSDVCSAFKKPPKACDDLM